MHVATYFAFSYKILAKCGPYSILPNGLTLSFIKVFGI